LCGTALKDDEFMKHLNEFEWIKNYKKPILGICAGMQLITLIFGGKLVGQEEIGMTQIITKDEIFGDKIISAYALHKDNVEPPEGFRVIAENVKGTQAIRKDKIYCILFHPEVRNKNLVQNFLNMR